MKNIFLITFIFLMLSCADDPTTETINIEGNYQGLFTVEYIDGAKYSNPVNLSLFENLSYVCSGNGNKNEFYPAGGSGSFKLQNGQMTFIDSNIWLAHFDWNLVLSGDYDYSFDNDKLTIFKDLADIGVYEYELTKTEVTAQD